MILDDAILKILLFFIVLELYEVSWQKEKTLIGMLTQMYHYYSKSVFLFLLMHPSFYFGIGFMIFSDFNGYAILLVIIKTADILTKIKLIEAVFIKQKISQEMSVMLLSPVHPLLAYIGVIGYPYLIYMALN